MNKYLTEVFTKMCSIVGADYDSIDFSADGWYSKYEWTDEQEKEFEKWMIEFLYTNNEARRELFGCRKVKKAIKPWVGMFLLSYGWKTKFKEQ